MGVNKEQAFNWFVLLRYLFHPPPEMKRQNYLRFAVTTVVLLSIFISVTITFILQQFSSQPNYLGGMFIAIAVPLVVVPPLAYWHHKLTFELVSSKRIIQELSRTDDLTGLFNRRYFFELAIDRLALARRHSHPVSLLLIDLDHFKSVNDGFGHPAGDEILKHIGLILRQTARSTDIPGRYGGEEFVLLMPNTAGDEAFSFCNRLRLEIRNRQIEKARQLPVVTLSIGLANSSRDGYDIDHLLLEADKALYQAKARGRDAVVASSETSVLSPKS